MRAGLYVYVVASMTPARKAAFYRYHRYMRCTGRLQASLWLSLARTRCCLVPQEADVG